VIVAIDGEPMAVRIERARKTTPAATPGMRDLTALRRALSGADGSIARLTLRDAASHNREVELKRSSGWRDRLNWRSGDKVRVLDGNIGYVDLDRLERDEVDGMFDKLGHTHAIIFDMRGYPNGTAWTIAPRLNVRGTRDAAVFERCVVKPEDTDKRNGLRHKFVQPLPALPPGKSLYRGRTLMLVDERTISQSEHTGLFFEAAAGTKFVGSQSAGSNGDVTAMLLPGGLRLLFTGHDVRHADGRQLQRVGLPVDYPVKPTLKGIQAGRDEVLERALEIARKEIDLSATKSQARAR
jgi:C-terminal processing protease CtpA/Prc